MAAAAWGSSGGSALAVATAALVAGCWRRRCAQPPRKSGRLGRRAATEAPPAPTSGLVKSIITRSKYPNERPKRGDLVRIHYVGRLSDGTVFDSSRARGVPFEFVLGETEVIDGWDIMIETMALGELSRLYIPPEYAYGEVGSEPYVPPNERLSFDVELLDIGTPAEPEQPVESPEEAARRAVQAAKQQQAEEDEVAPFWDKDPERENGQGRGFAWQATGTGKEICVTVPLPQDCKVGDIKVDIRTFSLLCKVSGKTIIDGRVSEDVDMDDSHWDLDVRDGKPYLLIYLAKLKPDLKWKSLMEGGDVVEEEPKVLAPDVINVDQAINFANKARRPKVIDT